MAEGLILPEANQIFLLTMDGLQWANYPNVSTECERPQTDQLPRKYSLSFFLVNVYSQNPKMYI